MTFRANEQKKLNDHNFWPDLHNDPSTFFESVGLYLIYLLVFMNFNIKIYSFAGSNATAGEPIGTSVLPSRVQANLNSMEEAGVGLMAPLVEDDNR